MRFLVTGGLGFIGTATIKKLERDHDVSSFDIKAGEDILDLNMLESAFKRSQPEVVFHFAARTSVVESIHQPFAYAETNILGTINVIEQCRKSGAKLIYASSGGTVYGEGKVPFRETDPARPFSPYGISKYTGELLVNDFHEERVILRYANVYGPDQSGEGESGVISKYIQRVLNNVKPIIRGDGRQTRDYIYIDDVVDANLMALKWKGTYNISTGISTSVLDLYKELEDTMNYKGGYDVVDSMGELEHVSLSCEKAKSLGWRAMVSLSEGIGKTVEHVSQG
ncbi:NAD-dependent epimerase/dehydratase family protein [Chloroflexota bacterium]